MLWVSLLSCSSHEWGQTLLWRNLYFFLFFTVKNLTATHAPLKVLIFASWKILKNLVLNTEVTRKWTHFNSGQKRLKSKYMYFQTWIFTLHHLRLPLSPTILLPDCSVRPLSLSLSGVFSCSCGVFQRSWCELRAGADPGNQSIPGSCEQLVWTNSQGCDWGFWPALRL